jgi:hypothetical protein
VTTRKQRYFLFNIARRKVSTYRFIGISDH